MVALITLLFLPFAFASTSNKTCTQEGAENIRSFINNETFISLLFEQQLRHQFFLNPYNCLLKNFVKKNNESNQFSGYIIYNDKNTGETITKYKYDDKMWIICEKENGFFIDFTQEQYTIPVPYDIRILDKPGIKGLLIVEKNKSIFIKYGFLFLSINKTREDWIAHDHFVGIVHFLLENGFKFNIDMVKIKTRVEMCQQYFFEVFGENSATILGVFGKNGPLLIVVVILSYQVTNKLQVHY